MVNRYLIEREVIAIIQSYMPKRVVDRDRLLIAELKMDSDDASAMINEIERKYSLKISATEWQKVGTPNQVIELILKHLS